jgi:hypothetical protein
MCNAGLLLAQERWEILISFQSKTPKENADSQNLSIDGIMLVYILNKPGVKA